MKTYILFGIIGLSLLVANCATDGRNKETKRVDLKASYKKMISSYNAIESDANRIANRQVELKDIPSILENICNNTCETNYLECTLGRAFPTIDLGGYPDRAPKDFSNEIPDCEGTACDDIQIVPADEIQPCDDARDICLKRCACQYLRK